MSDLEQLNEVTDDELNIISDEEDDNIFDDENDDNLSIISDEEEVVDSEQEQDPEAEYDENSNVNKSENSELNESQDDEDEDDDEDDEDEKYLQKFDNEVRTQFIENFHPEVLSHNYQEVKSLAKITRDKNGLVVDKLHKTIPFLTKYEKARVVGQRAKQIDAGAQPLIKVSTGMVESYLIALKELELKKIPFIIKRPIPNGGFEYWNLSDLEILD